MSKNKFVVKTLVISMAAAMAAPVLADSKQLPRIDVVGQGQDAVAKQPAAVSIVTKQDLEILQPLSTEDALRRVPGVNIKGEEETAIVANFAIRGLRADQSKTLVLEDGVPVQPGLFVGDGRYYNPRIQRMESIEVLKGASSLRYGPSTIGGVINYITKTPEDGVNVTGRVGSFGLREATLEAGGSNPSGDAFAGVVYTKAESDGFQNKGYKMDDLMVKAGTAIGDNQMVSVKFSHYENIANMSYRGLFLDDLKRGATYNPAPNDFLELERQALDINHEWDINDNLRLNTLVYWSKHQRDYWRMRSVNEVNSVTAGRWVYVDADGLQGNNRTYERKGVDSRLNFAHNAFDLPNQTELGVRFLTEERTNLTIRSTLANPRSGALNGHTVESADSFALFAQNRIELTDKLAVTAGVRVEKYDLLRQDKRNTANKATTSNTEILPGLGATYQLTPTNQLYASVYQAFSPATTGDSLAACPNNGASLVPACTPGDYIEQDLDAERSTNFEMGLRGGDQRVTYEVTAFQMDFSNQVVTGNSDPSLLRTNAGSTLHQGLEAGVGYVIGGGFSVDTNLTYIPVSESTSGSNRGKRLPYAPEIIANAALNYQVGSLRTSLSAHHTGEQFGNADNTKEVRGTGANGVGGIWGGKLDSYTTFDLNAHYTINKQLAVFGAVKNLTDERYIAGLRQGIYAGPSRAFELGAKYKF
jgi:Fe(3+) dicitrate transport protein